jgi:hypothetical protein
MPIAPVNLLLGNYTVDVCYPNLPLQQGLGDSMIRGISDASTDPSRLSRKNPRKSEDLCGL